tara:strand:- start:31967 stop:32143 length:177 start_codon:yes stop_codon:yes gene_type:complete
MLIMDVTLDKEFEKKISEKISDGLYTSASEVNGYELRLLIEKDNIKNKELEILRKEVA